MLQEVAVATAHEDEAKKRQASQGQGNDYTDIDYLFKSFYSVSVCYNALELTLAMFYVWSDTLLVLGFFSVLGLGLLDRDRGIGIDIDCKVLQAALCNILTVSNSASLRIAYSNAFISSWSSIVAASSDSESKARMVSWHRRR